MAVPTKVFADSSALIAYFNPADVNHEAAAGFLGRLEQEVSMSQVVISNFIFSETVTVLSMRQGKESALKAGALLLQHPQIQTVVIDEALQQAAWNIFQEISGKNMSFVDCSILALMDSEGIDTLLTFDLKDFKPLRKKYGFKLMSL